MSFIRTHVAYLTLMNRINIDGVLIVEGKADVSYLSSFVNALFFITNGYDLSKKKIEFLKAASKVNKLIIYTDPDEAGEKIRNVLKSQINPIFEAKSEKIIRKNKKKSGVAELEKDEAIRSLSAYQTSKEMDVIDYDLVSLVSLNKNPREIKDRLIEKYRLIEGNNKSLENQLNILKISKKEIEDFIRGN